MIDGYQTGLGHVTSRNVQMSSPHWFGSREGARLLDIEFPCSTGGLPSLSHRHRIVKLCDKESCEVGAEATFEARNASPPEPLTWGNLYDGNPGAQPRASEVEILDPGSDRAIPGNIGIRPIRAVRRPRESRRRALNSTTRAKVELFKRTRALG